MGPARRITAICSLRYQDLRLEVTPSAPYGAVRWPDDTDKEGHEWVCPIDAKVRAAIDRILRERPGIGSAFMFVTPYAFGPDFQGTRDSVAARG